MREALPAFFILFAFTHAESWAEWAQRKGAEAINQATVTVAKMAWERALQSHLGMKNVLQNVDLFAKVQNIDVDSFAALPDAELRVARLCAHLSAAAYGSNADELVTELQHISALTGTSLELVGAEFQKQNLERNETPWDFYVHNPQWFVARAGAQSLFVVFRGTHSLSDVIRDLAAMPSYHADSGCYFHGGFLDGIQSLTKLHRLVEAEHIKEYANVYVTGHSLGGALASTFVGAGSLARAIATTKWHLLTFGSPMVLHATNGPCKVASLERSRFQSFVYGADIVPRLLGSDLPLLRAAIATFADTQVDAQVLKTFTDYYHPPNLELVYIVPRDKAARLVPAVNQSALLDLYQAVSPYALTHHSLYPSGLEAMGVGATEARTHDEQDEL